MGGLGGEEAAGRREMSQRAEPSPGEKYGEHPNMALAAATGEGVTKRKGAGN